MNESAQMMKSADRYQLRPAVLSEIDDLTALINRAYRPVQGQEGLHSLPYPNDKNVGEPKQPLMLIEMEKDI